MRFLLGRALSWVAGPEMALVISLSLKSGEPSGEYCVEVAWRDSGGKEVWRRGCAERVVVLVEESLREGWLRFVGTVRVGRWRGRDREPGAGGELEV